MNRIQSAMFEDNFHERILVERAEDQGLATIKPMDWKFTVKYESGTDFCLCKAFIYWKKCPQWTLQRILQDQRKDYEKS